MYMIPYGVGKTISDLHILNRTVGSVTGGMSLAKREFYETVGIQDENLFMSSDEVDIALRSKDKGYILAVTKSVRSWHQYINLPCKTKRPPYTAFLIGRNKVYLGYKHFGFAKAFYIFLGHLFIFFGRMPNRLSSNEKLKFQFYFLFGTFCGILKLNINFNFIYR